MNLWLLSRSPHLVVHLSPLLNATLTWLRLNDSLSSKPVRLPGFGRQSILLVTDQGLSVCGVFIVCSSPIVIALSPSPILPEAAPPGYAIGRVRLGLATQRILLFSLSYLSVRPVYFFRAGSDLKSLAYAQTLLPLARRHPICHRHLALHHLCCFTDQPEIMV